MAGALSLILISHHLYAQETLPLGTNPPAIQFKYFPNKVYALVWRNWNLVEPDAIAKTIGCHARDITDLAASMGLPKAQKIPLSYKRQMFISVVRRNWHLLPYEQMLTLLNVSARELSVSLRDDDFLFIKLGSLKPNCPRIVYQKPGPNDIRRASEIKHLVQRYFAQLLQSPEEPRFNFIKQLRMPDAHASVISNKEGLRFIYSYFGVFGDPLIDTAINPYPGGLLARLAGQGINGVWLHVVLDQLAPGGTNFPEFGAGYQARIDNLRQMVKRAGKYGIQVYLYLNEPRAMPLAFFKNRQDMQGVREEDVAAMCTSDKKVMDWISGSLAYIFKEVPGLGGVFTITASENLTNCASHGNQQSCPRCSKRTYADVIAGVNAAIASGVHQGNPNAKVMVWDWGWHDNDAPAIISKLPGDVWLMSVSEWKKAYERGGVKANVGEYSMSVVGPGDHAMGHWKLAKEAGLKTVAKVQFNNTWELSAIPWLPVPDLVAEHAANLAKEQIDGVMLSWSLGGFPSPNLEIAQAFSQHPDAKPEDVLNALALKRYGSHAAPYVRKAWHSFSRAFQQFPFSTNVVYRSPVQYGPSNLLFAEPSGYKATMVGFPYDDLNSWLAPYPKEVFVDQFKQLVQGWKDGLRLFSIAVKQASGHKRAVAEKDLQLAQVGLIHFSSVANQAQFIICRDSLLTAQFTKSEKIVLKRKIEDLLNDEIALSQKLFEITRSNSVVGFEASNQYYYVSQDLMEKVINCEYVRNQLEKIK